MTTHVKTFIAALALLAGGAHAQTCKTTDPSGTPLNVRASPNGQIVGTLPNNLTVIALSTLDDANGKPWTYIQWKGHTIYVRPSSTTLHTRLQKGWVFREYISCVSTGDSQ